MKENVPLLDTTEDKQRQAGSLEGLEKLQVLLDDSGPEPLSRVQMCFQAFLLGLMRGLIGGYMRSLFFCLFESGNNYWHQAVLNTLYLPNLFRFIVASLVDTYYIRSLGRSRSSLIGFPLISTIALVLASTNVDHWIRQHAVLFVTSSMFFINVSSVAFQSAAEAYIARSADPDSKSRAATWLDTGSGVGEFIAFNLFMIISSPFKVQFLGIQVDQPLVMHRGFLQLIGFVQIFCCIYGIFFFREPKTQMVGGKPEARLICKTWKQLLGDNAYCQLLIYASVTKCFITCVTAVIQLKLMEAGFSRPDFALVETVALPSALVLTFFASRDLKPESLLLWHNWSAILASGNLAMKYGIYIDLDLHHNRLRTMLMAAIVISLEKLFIRNVYINSYCIQVSPKSCAASFLSGLQTAMNIFFTLPSSLSLLLFSTGWIHPHLYVFGTLMLQVVVNVRNFSICSKAKQMGEGFQALDYLPPSAWRQPI